MLIESFALIERLEKVTQQDVIELRALKTEIKSQSNECKKELYNWIPLSKKDTFGAFIALLFASDGGMFKDTRISIYNSWLCDQEYLDKFECKHKPGSAVELHAYHIMICLYLDSLDLFK